MYGIALVLIFVVDLALFVLVFLTVRAPRMRTGRRAAIIGLSTAAYLVSLVLLIAVSSHL